MIYPSLPHLASSLLSLSPYLFLVCSSVSVYLVCVFPSLLVWSLYLSAPVCSCSCSCSCAVPRDCCQSDGCLPELQQFFLTFWREMASLRSKVWGKSCSNHSDLRQVSWVLGVIAAVNEEWMMSVIKEDRPGRQTFTKWIGRGLTCRWMIWINGWVQFL